MACRLNGSRRLVAVDGVVDSRPSALQRVAVLPKAGRFQYRLARNAEAKNCQLGFATRASDQTRACKPRGRSQQILFRFSRTGGDNATHAASAGDCKWAELHHDLKATLEAIESVVDFVESGHDSLTFPLDIRGTSFQLRVRQAVSDIPFATTTTFAGIATATSRFPTSIETEKRGGLRAILSLLACLSCGDRGSPACQPLA